LADIDDSRPAYKFVTEIEVIVNRYEHCPDKGPRSDAIRTYCRDINRIYIDFASKPANLSPLLCFYEACKYDCPARKEVLTKIGILFSRMIKSCNTKEELLKLQENLSKYPSFNGSNEESQLSSAIIYFDERQAKKYMK